MIVFRIIPEWEVYFIGHWMAEYFISPNTLREIGKTESSSNILALSSGALIVNRNHAAAFLGIVGMLGLGAAIAYKRPWLYAVAGLTLISVPLTGSKAGLLLLIVLLTAFFVTRAITTYAVSTKKVLGIVFVLGVSSLGAYALLLAGWGSSNKYSLLGALRASAQMISYELALGLALVGILLLYVYHT